MSRLRDGYAYVAEGTGDYDGGLHVVDVSDPSSPVLVGSVATIGDAHGVAVSDGYAYVADDWFYFNVVDISAPAAPMIVRTIRSPHRVFDVVIDEDIAYLADGLSGLQVVDISVPAQARLIGSHDNLDFATGVATDGEHVYLADGSAGFHILPRHCRSTMAIPLLSPSPAQELTVRATPNPAMSWVRIQYPPSLPGTKVSLAVYDAQGRCVRTLGGSGAGSELWDGRDGAGRRLPAGVYWVNLVSGHNRQSVKVTLLD